MQRAIPGDPDAPRNARLGAKFQPAAFLLVSRCSWRFHGTTEVEDGTNEASKQRAKVMQELLARVWLVLGCICESLLERSALSTMKPAPTLPSLAEFLPGVLRPAQTEVGFPRIEGEGAVGPWSNVNAEEALAILVSSKSVQEATGLGRQGLLRRCSAKWTVDVALEDSADRPSNHRMMEGGSPLLKSLPTLMAIENLFTKSVTVGSWSQCLQSVFYQIPSTSGFRLLNKPWLDNAWKRKLIRNENQSKSVFLVF
ncbi:hypothetical protein EDB19DRAFT_1736521 [Suillus lakei]|nr:hypothetical protein EDB19DRAFT_1736521 [Suillus lakei]